jgi:hypothetical protein
MGKRASTQSAKSANKKAKTDPVLTSVAEVIMQAEDLPDRCRSMLVDMLPFSLSVPSDERHELQAWAVGAIEQTLDAKKTILEEAIVAEDAKLTNLKSSEVTLASAVQEAEAALDAQKQVALTALSALAEAREVCQSASETLLSVQAVQSTGEAQLTSALEEKTALESAFEAHFNVPTQEGNGPHFKELQPFLKDVEMDASLLKALPSSCSKLKSDRGSFDDVVVGQLEQALTSRITVLGDLIAVETPASDVRKSAVDAAEKDQMAKQETLQQSQDACASAKAEENDREAALTKARQAMEEFQPQVESATGMVDKAKESLTVFEAGPLIGFTTYKAKVAISAEAGCAGA